MPFSPNTPNLTLSLELQGLSESKIAKRKSNSGRIFHIHRGTDGHNRPCSFYWFDTVDAWGSAGLVLLRHKADDQLERVTLPTEPWRVHDPTGPRITRNAQCLFELSPGESTWFFAGITESWLDAMVPGEKYELLWPGGEIYWWAWGSIDENEKRGKSCDNIPRAFLSGTPRVSFTVVEEPPAPIYETLRPKWLSAPAQSLIEVLSPQKTQIPSQSRLHGQLPFDALYLMIPLELAFQSREDGEWQYCPNHSVGCAMTDLIYDTEMAVNIGKDRRWISLAPGESWSQELEIGEGLPIDLAPGDRIRYQLEGRILEMWNWGSKEDHAETVLMLPSGRNAGDWIDRSPIGVPASNSFEFTIIE